MSQRKTVYNQNLTSEEELKQINVKNKKLMKEFVYYCISNDRSPATVKQYEEQLKLFFVWNLRENQNKPFYEIKKREFVSFFGWGRNELGWSSSRLSSFRSVLSSLSNYIERILDDEFPLFKNVIKVLEPIRVEAVREKTVLKPEQIEEAIEKLLEQKQTQEACWLALLFSSGMRKSEATQMKVEFFKPENIVFDIMYRTPKIRTKGRGKSGKQVPRYVFTLTFQKYLDLWLEEREKLGIVNEELFVIKKKEGYKPATSVTFNSWAQRLGAVMGVEMYPHSLRHAWTTKLKKEGYPDAIIQKLQQWASSDMVGVYNDSTDEEEMESFFSGK